MKKLFLFLSIAGMFVSCDSKYTETVTYQVNEPVYMTSEAFRSSVAVTDEQHAVTGGGKICFYNGYLYISEPGTGIHIIDNRNPSNPHAVGFIQLLGNADLAIRNDLLYADAFASLAWFDISDPAKPQVKGIVENVFPDILPPMDNGYGYDYEDVTAARSKGVIVGWKLTKKTKEVEYYRGWGRGIYYDMASGAEKSTGGGTGVNGSMSRFGWYKDYLYTVINNYMSIFDLSDEAPKKAVENIYIGWNVETIFSYKDNLFFGTPTGLLIYSVADPLNPKPCSSISHVLGCDPVVVENDLAYVTIHSGNMCGQNNNILFVVDVKDVNKPQQLVSYTMTHPKGLGIDNGTLFVCDDGLKVFKADNPQTIMANQLAHYKGMSGFDVIPFDNVLMMIADDGLYQYDYSDLKNIKELGALKFAK